MLKLSVFLSPFQVMHRDLIHTLDLNHGLSHREVRLARQFLSRHDHANIRHLGIQNSLPDRKIEAFSQLERSNDLVSSATSTVDTL